MKLLEVFKFPFLWLRCVLFSHFQSSVEIIYKLSEQNLHMPVPFVMYNFGVWALLLWLPLGFMAVFVQLTDCAFLCMTVPKGNRVESSAQPSLYPTHCDWYSDPEVTKYFT